MKNILLTVEYDGTLFVGWQRQPGQRSVQGELEKGLALLFDKPIELLASSRTDAGVHAYGQKTNFIADFPMPVAKIRQAINGFLPSDVIITQAEEVPLEFHARFSAIGKRYVYKIIRADDRRIFDRNYALTVTRSLDVEAMKTAAQYFIGTHDFKAFCGNNGQINKNTERTIHSMTVSLQPQNAVHIEVVGNAFLYKMVRMMTGSLLNIGYGKNPPEAIGQILEGKMKRIGNTAKPQGLYLVEVYFDQEKLRRTL